MNYSNNEYSSKNYCFHPHHLHHQQHYQQHQRQHCLEPLANAFIDDWRWSNDDRLNEIDISNNGQVASFHIEWSSGTAGVRGDKPINLHPNCKYYWEVLLKDRVFGTSMMIGLTTRQAKLYSSSYINLIGENKFGWGLSHKGLLWHNNHWREYTKPFPENFSTKIGLLYDNGSVTFYKDGHCLGVAFTGLDKIKDHLYPTISSTAAQSQFILTVAKRDFINLQDHCRNVLRQQLATKHRNIYRWQKLLPPTIFNYLLLQDEQEEATSID